MIGAIALKVRNEVVSREVAFR